MRGNIVRSEEWVVMRYNSVLDLHTHTLVSGHAYCSLREMAKAAADKGLEVLGITEHAVKKRLQRGREQFRTIWKEEYCR